MFVFKLMYQRNMQSAIFKSCLAVLMSAALISCSGSSSDPDETEDSIFGTLVVPEQAADIDAVLNRQFARLMRNDPECPNVPEGYQPLANATIEFIDANGNVVGQNFTTDDCGDFGGRPPTTSVSIRVVAPGFRPLVAEIGAFSGLTGGIASTISDQADYAISSLQVIDDTTLAFTVTDTVSQKAVLGIPAKAFSIDIDDVVGGVSSLSVSSSVGNPISASTVLVMDASGSMEAVAYVAPDGVSYTGTQLAAIAAHEYVTLKSLDDRVALSIFDDGVYFMDKATVNNFLPVQALDGQPVEYEIEGNGFVRDGGQLRFLIDAYNSQSVLYTGGVDQLHPDTPRDIQPAYFRYPFGGSTRLYAAISDALRKLDSSGASRPLVVAMTDGEDTSFFDRVSEVISLANSFSIPVQTVGMGDSVNVTELQQLADETGGTFFNVVSNEVAGAFESIQTGILFQYIAGVGQEYPSLTSAANIVVALDFNGLVARRTITQFQ